MCTEQVQYKNMIYTRIYIIKYLYIQFNISFLFVVYNFFKWLYLYCIIQYIITRVKHSQYRLILLCNYHLYTFENFNPSGASILKTFNSWYNLTYVTIPAIIVCSFYSLQRWSSSSRKLYLKYITEESSYPFNRQYIYH